MERENWIQLGILFVLFGGFILVDTNSSLPFGLDFMMMALGLVFGLVGVVPKKA